MSNLRIARRRPAAGALSILTLACFGLAACGGSSGTSTNATATRTGSTPAAASTSTAPSTSTSTRPSTSTPQPSGQSSIAAAFAAQRECLRKSGITLPNPATALGAGAVKLPNGMTHAQYEAALRKCSEALSVAPRRADLGFKGAVAKYAECLRHNGVNLPPPNTSGKGPLIDTSGLKKNSPQFKAAILKCRVILIGAFRNLSRPGRP